MFAAMRRASFKVSTLAMSALNGQGTKLTKLTGEKKKRLSWRLSSQSERLGPPRSPIHLYGTKISGWDPFFLGSFL
jgi:hypothetical protein